MTIDWTYGLDGALNAIPCEDRFPQGVPCGERPGDGLAGPLPVSRHDLG